MYFRVCIQRHRLSTRPSFTETKNQFDRALGPRSVPVPPAFLLAKLVLRLPHANPVPVAAPALAGGVAGLPTETAAILPGIEPALVPIVEPAPIRSVTVVPPAAPTAAAASIAPTAHTAPPAAPPASSHRRASPPLLLARPEPLVRAAAFTAAERIPARAVRTVTVPTPVPAPVATAAVVFTSVQAVEVAAEPSFSPRPAAEIRVAIAHARPVAAALAAAPLGIEPATSASPARRPSVPSVVAAVVKAVAARSTALEPIEPALGIPIVEAAIPAALSTAAVPAESVIGSTFHRAPTWRRPVPVVVVVVPFVAASSRGSVKTGIVSAATPLGIVPATSATAPSAPTG